MPLVSFWFLTLLYCLLLFAASAPSPLYVIYQSQWHFSSAILTSIFSVYALALLGTMILGGSISDFVGRKPVLIIALLLEIICMLIFIEAKGVGWLLTARTLQGICTAIAVSTISASLIDLQSLGNTKIGQIIGSAIPNIGLAFGALGAGFLVQYAPAPTKTIFLILLIMFVLAILGVIILTEPNKNRAGPLRKLRPNIKIPKEIRPVFFKAIPALIAGWSLSGIYLSLGPSLVKELLQNNNHLIGGFSVSIVTGMGGLAAILFRRWEHNRAMIIGSLFLISGISLTLVSLWLISLPLFFTGSMISGLGYGTLFLGAFRSITSLASPDKRAGVISSIYVVVYLSFSLPTIGAGIIINYLGLFKTIHVAGIMIAILALISLVIFAKLKPSLKHNLQF